MTSKLPYVVVRTYSAGVHVGELKSRTGQELELVNARRIWSWKGANTLNEIATHGVGPGSRVSVAVPSIVLIQAIEVISTTTESEAVLRSASWS